MRVGVCTHEFYRIIRVSELRWRARTKQLLFMMLRA